jgi:hypothetical protein
MATLALSGFPLSHLCDLPLSVYNIPTVDAATARASIGRIQKNPLTSTLEWIDG